MKRLIPIISILVLTVGLAARQAPKINVTNAMILNPPTDSWPTYFGDYSGKPEEALPALKNRKFVEIDRDNFDQVLSGMKPRLAYNVDNKLQEDGSKVGVELKFNKIDDFEPDNVVQQVEPLRKLVEAREKLSDLLSKMDGNEKLEGILNDLMADQDKQKELSSQLGLEAKED